MKQFWTEELFNTKKPIIAMCHLQALPGDPGYDKPGGMKKVIDLARKDLLALQDGGVDGIMFSNEFSLPYLLKVRPETTAAMACIIGELKSEITIPYGVNVLWDPYASLDLVAAVEGKFVREIFSGVYASDFGIWNTNCGDVVRHQHSLGVENVKLIFNIVPEAAEYLAPRNICEVARSTVFNHLPDALCVSGLTAGTETNATILKQVKDAVPDMVVFANTGVCLKNIEEQLSISNGAIVATTFKYDGIFRNAVDVKRVKSFMDKVKSFRNNFE
jgi:membrane complex biogenesis BtpA family protein